MWFFDGAIKGFLALCGIVFAGLMIAITLVGFLELNEWLFINWSETEIAILSLAELLVVLFMAIGAYDEWDKRRWAKRIG